MGDAGDGLWGRPLKRVPCGWGTRTRCEWGTWARCEWRTWMDGAAPLFRVYAHPAYRPAVGRHGGGGGLSLAYPAYLNRGQSSARAAAEGSG